MNKEVSEILILEKIKSVKFSPAEQEVVNYMIDYPEKIKNETVKNIAEKNYTQPSTLVRISKKMGYSGWVEFRTAYIEEWEYLNYFFTDLDANQPFCSTDSTMTIARNIATLKKNTINDSFSLMDVSNLEKAKEILIKSNDVKVFGFSSNVKIAQDFALKMCRIRKNTKVVTDAGEEMYEAFNSSKETCAILISYTGENPKILKVSNIFRELNIPTIGITSIGDNSLSKSVNCFLPITTREKLYSKISSYTVNTSIIYTLDVLYSLVFAENYTENFKYLVNTGQKIDKRESSVSVIKEN